MRLQAVAFFLSFLIVNAPAFPGTPLNANEKKILAYVKSHREEAISFLERAVEINSGTLNQTGVREVGELFEKEFQGLGFETKWINLPPEMNRAAHLFAYHQGKTGKRILLIGHLDTVFEKDTPFQHFSRSGARATGPGVNDMKGGDVVILYALKALQSVDGIRNSTITVALLSDEEKPGQPTEVSRAALVEAAKQSDIALGYETAASMDTATVARRGVSTWKLEISAKEGHSSGIFSPDQGSGAIFEASRILHSFEEQLKGEKFLTFNPGVIVGGSQITYDSTTSRGTAFGKTNVIASKATVEGDLRFISNEQKEAVREKMRAIVDQSAPHVTSQITFEDGYPPMPPTDGNLALLRLLDQVSQDLGYGPVTAYDPGGRGAADISFVASYVDGLDGLGVLGDGAHTTLEDIDLESLPVAIQRTAILMHRLTKK